MTLAGYKLSLLFAAVLTVTLSKAESVKAFAQDCDGKPCTVAPPVPRDGSLSSIFDKSGNAFLRGTLPTQDELTGQWRAVFIAPVDEYWNNDRKLPLGYDASGTPNAMPFSLRFSVFKSVMNEFFDLPSNTTFVAEFASSYKKADGQYATSSEEPRQVSFTKDSAVFATYARTADGVREVNYFDHECRLLKGPRLICAITFRTTDASQVATKNVPYLSHVVGYIGYVKAPQVMPPNPSLSPN